MDTRSRIDEDSATVTRTVRIEAPRDLVFEVLTRPDQMAQWFGQSADFPQGVHLGAEGTFGWRDHGDFPARVELYEPPSGFAFTWGTPGEPIRQDNSTTATFSLQEEEGVTVLTVTESGFDTLGEAAGRRAAMEENAQGWTEELDDLVAHAEGLSSGTGLRPVADLDAGRIVRTVLVRAPRPVTWSVLTDPEAIEAWWGHPARFEDGIRTGAAGTFEWTGHGLMPMVVERADGPERLELRWGGLGEAGPGPDASLVCFALAPVGGDRTLVTVTETGFSGLEGAGRAAAMQDNVAGWTGVLDGLVRHVEQVAA